MRTRNTQLMCMMSPDAFRMSKQHRYEPSPLECNLLRVGMHNAWHPVGVPHMGALFPSHWTDSIDSYSKRPDLVMFSLTENEQPLPLWQLSSALWRCSHGVSLLLCLTFSGIVSHQLHLVYFPQVGSWGTLWQGFPKVIDLKILFYTETHYLCVHTYIILKQKFTK